MDDFNLSSLTESRNEYSSLLLKKITPLIIHGFNSMFEDTVKMCEENDEEEKYLMTFQNFLTRVPKWNKNIIDGEVSRIKQETNCSYIEDLLTCVHITHLKILTNVRVGHKQKKININIPPFDLFVHKVYIEVARRLYKNVYLYEMDIMPIQKQRNHKEIEHIVNESILDVIRSNMPIENILKAYLDESSETRIFEKVEEIDVPPDSDIEETTNNKKQSLSELIKSELNNQEYLIDNDAYTPTPTPTPTPSHSPIQRASTISPSSFATTPATPVPVPVPTPVPISKNNVSFEPSINTGSKSIVKQLGSINANNTHKKVGFVGSSLTNDNYSNASDADDDFDEDKIKISNANNMNIDLDIEELH